MAFLEVLTRTFGKRPQALRRNQNSLRTQTDPDMQHTVIVDEVGRGVAWANGNLRNIIATGEYVWVLDDDDRCMRDTLVAEIKEIAAREQPDVIVMRAHHAVFGLLPNKEHWQRAPVCGQIGWSCVAVRGEIWNAHRQAHDESYAGDYVFIRHLWDTPGLKWYWHEYTAAFYPVQSRGAAEHAP